MELSLIEVIKQRKDKSKLLKGLSWIHEYEEDKLIDMYEKDGSFFRFGILSGVLTFMIAAYHSVVRDAEQTEQNQTVMAPDILPAS